MYNWYKNAKVCFVYLNDVFCEPGDVLSPKTTIGEEQAFYIHRDFWYPKEPRPDLRLGDNTVLQLRKSEWFTRGWTLQELIAPMYVVFVDKDWRLFGAKSTLNNLLSDITGIESVATLRLELESVATKMSWASKRACTRSEDQAYSLMGLFNVNMPLLYGEGGRKAFLRLQLEILKSSDDESIFAWSYRESIPGLVDALWRGILARAPEEFLHSANIRPFRSRIPRAPYTMTNKGLEIETMLLSTSSVDRGRMVVLLPLNCVRLGDELPVAIPLTSFGPDGAYARLFDNDYSISWPGKRKLLGRAHFPPRKILIRDPILQTPSIYGDREAHSGLWHSLQQEMARYQQDQTPNHQQSRIGFP